MKLIDSYTLKPIADNRRDYEMKVKKNPSARRFSLPMSGFGVSAGASRGGFMLSYAGRFHYSSWSKPESIYILRYKSALADLFIEVVSRRNIQIILESHSEHLLRRIQRRIAEQKIDSREVSLYFCKMEKDASAMEKLQMDEFGNISNWPRTFLEMS